VGRLRVQRGDGRLDLVGTGRAVGQRAVEQPGGLGDQRPVPPAAVLVGKPDQAAPPVEPGRGPGLVQQEQCQQAEDLGLARHQPVQQPGKRHCLGGQVTAGGLPTRAGQVALVEDQVHHGQHLGQPVSELVGVGNAQVSACGTQRLARPQQPLGHGRLSGQEGGRDLGRGQAADGAQGKRDLRLARQRGMAAGEDHAEQFVVGRLGLGAGIGGGRRQQGQLLLTGPGPAQPVDRLAPGGGGQPAARVGRRRVPPVLEGLDERVLDGVRGQPDVADPRGQRGGDAGRFGPVDALELSLVHDRGGRRAQAPLNRGGRFSAKAASPSAKSPEAAISFWIPASNSSWASIRSYSHLLSWRLVPAYDLVAPAAIRSSSASACAWYSSSGQTRLIRPQSSAERASSRSPSMASSAARAKPTRDGTHSDDPPSGTSPMLTKASEKYADSAATTRSQASARESPIPAAGPLTPAMTGLGIRRMPVISGWYRSVRILYTSTVPPPASSVVSFRSAPLEKARPAPVMRIARTSGFSVTSVIASHRSAENCRLHAFIRSGRFSSTFAPGPRRYRLTVSYWRYSSSSLTSAIISGGSGGSSPRA